MNKTMMATCALLAAATALGGELALYDIVPYSPGHEAEAARDIRAVHEKSGLDTFLYSVSLDPRGYPAFDNVRAATASYRRLKAELGDAPVRLGFLLQSILGHWPRVDKEVEPWQRSVDIGGAVKRFCVLDPRYQDYIRKTGAALAAECPCFILGDDDIRAFSPNAECFCPLHAAEFNRRTGKAYAPEEYRLAIAGGKAKAEDEAAYLKLRGEIPLTVARLLREGIDSVDPSIPGGACMPGAEQLRVVNWAGALSGKGHPVTLRLANGLYREMAPRDMIRYVLATQSYIDALRPSVDRLLDESDSFPHTLYVRSGRTFISKLALGVFCGLRGAKLWFVGMHKQTERVPEAHDRALGENRRLLESLAQALDGSAPVGVRIPADNCTTKWATEIFGLYGVPFCSDRSVKAGGPLLISGAEGADGLDDKAVEEAFRGRVFVDGPASVKLAARGFGDRLGCKPVMDGRAYNIEVVCADGSRPPITKAHTTALTEVVPGAVVCSELRYAPSGSSAPDSEYVAAGSLCYTNKSGGVALCTGFDAQDECTVQNQRRRIWLDRVLRTLDPAFPVLGDMPEPNMTQARAGRDGRTYAFTVNFSYDDIETLSYRTARPMDRAEILGSDGVWRKAGAVRDGESWKVAHRLPCMGFAVLRW